MSRTAKNRIKTLMETVRDNFRLDIKGETYYNNTLTDNHINIGYKSIEETNLFPAIWVASVSESGSSPVRRIEFDVPFEIEILGYTKGLDSAMDDALELQSDIEQSIFQRERCGLFKFNSFSTDVIAIDGFGIVYCVLSGVSEYSKE